MRARTALKALGLTPPSARPLAPVASAIIESLQERLDKRWMSRTRPAPGPDSTRRPLWFDRPLRPEAEAYKVSE